MQSRVFLAADEIFKGEREESLEKLASVSDLLRRFRSLYAGARRRIGTAAADAGTQDDVNEVWDFPESMAFRRMRRFERRVEQLEVGWRWCLGSNPAVTLNFFCSFNVQRVRHNLRRLS